MCFHGLQWSGTPDNSAQHCGDTFGCYEPGFAKGCLHWSLTIFHKLAVEALHWTICSLRLSVCATWKLGWSKLIFSQLSRNFAMSFVIVICLPKQLLCNCGLLAELLVSRTEQFCNLCCIQVDWQFFVEYEGSYYFSITVPKGKQFSVTAIHWHNCFSLEEPLLCSD